MIMSSANGEPNSGPPRSSIRSWPSETVAPVSGSASASRRFAGVMRLAAPSVSSAPQRPQLESSVIHRSNCSRVAPGPFSAAPGCAPATAPATTIRASRPAATASFELMGRCTSAPVSSG